MISRRPYYGPIECPTIEEWAVRFRCSVDHFDKEYTGRRIRLGSILRIYAADVHEWLDARTGGSVTVDTWAGVGDAGVAGGAHAEEDEVQGRAAASGKRR